MILFTVVLMMLCSLHSSIARIEGLKNYSLRRHSILILELTPQADNNRVTLRWMPDHNGIDGNEKVDKLANKPQRNHSSQEK